MRYCVDANQAVRVMLDEVARLQREPIGADDISAVIAQFPTTYYISQKTNAAQAALSFLEKLRAVTPVDVQRVAARQSAADR